MTHSVFSNFTSQAVKVKTLGVGIWTVILVALTELNSFLNADGSKKDKVYPWSDATPQILLTLYSPAEKAFFYVRLNGLGYQRPDELTDKELQSGKYQIEGRYVLDKKTLARIPSDKHTAEAHSIINEVFNAIQLEEGSTIEDLMAEAVKPWDDESRIQFNVKIVSEPYEDEEQLRVKSYRRHKAAVTTDFE